MATTSSSSTASIVTTTPPSSSPPSVVTRKTALASAAGTTQPQKHRPTSLRTPLTGTYPSTIHSPSTSFSASAFHNIPPTPVSGIPDYNNQKHHHDNNIPPSSATSFTSRTPLTPPPAYLDFLKAVSPSILPSPLSTGTSVHFSFSATSTKSPGFPVPNSASLAGKWTGRERWPNHAHGQAQGRGRGHTRSTSWSQRPVLSSHVSEESVASVSASSVSSYESMESLESDASASSAPLVPASRDVDEEMTAATPPTRSKSDGQIQPPLATYASPTATTTTSSGNGSADSTPTKPPTTAPTTITPQKRPHGPLRRPSIIIPPSPSTSIPIPISASSLSAMSPPTSAGPQPAPRTVSVRQVVTKTVIYNRGHQAHGTHGVGGQGPEQKSTETLKGSMAGGRVRSKSLIDASAGRMDGPGKVEDEAEGEGATGTLVKVELDLEAATPPSRQSTPKPLVGEAPRGKRRKVN